MVSNALTLLDNFNKLTPYAVGFDRVFDNLNRYVDNNVTSTGFFRFGQMERKTQMTHISGHLFRRFDRKFTLADDIVVNGASLENGMLTIDIIRKEGDYNYVIDDMNILGIAEGKSRHHFGKDDIVS